MSETSKKILKALCLTAPIDQENVIAQIVQSELDAAVEKATKEMHQTLLNREETLKRSGDDWVRAKTETDLVKLDRDTLQTKLDEANKELAEAQQWLDSEPDWKNKFMADYLQLSLTLQTMREALIYLREKVQNSDVPQAYTEHIIDKALSTPPTSGELLLKEIVEFTKTVMQETETGSYLYEHAKVTLSQLTPPQTKQG